MWDVLATTFITKYDNLFNGIKIMSRYAVSKDCTSLKELGFFDHIWWFINERLPLSLYFATYWNTAGQKRFGFPEYSGTSFQLCTSTNITCLKRSDPMKVEAGAGNKNLHIVRLLGCGWLWDLGDPVTPRHLAAILPEQGSTNYALHLTTSTWTVRSAANTPTATV